MLRWTSMVYVLLALAWILVGVATGLVEARRGHWKHSWALGVVLGPFTIPLALDGRREERLVEPRVLAVGSTGRGDLDLLVGVDGSARSHAAAEHAVRLFGPRLRSLALASVLDFDTAEPTSADDLNAPGLEDQRAAEERLATLAAELRDETGVDPTTVVLAGSPATALERHAADQDADVLVVGCRGAGRSKALLGSCASRLAGSSSVPVLLVPAEPPTHERRP